MLHTDIHTDRPSDEAGPRGAFAPNNLILTLFKMNLKKHVKYNVCLETGSEYFGSAVFETIHYISFPLYTIS